MQCIIDDANMDELFIKLCKEESVTKTTQKIGFNFNN
jgi:hypothetical protein